MPTISTALEIANAIPAGLRAQSRHVELEAGEILFRIGGKVCNVYLVISGEVRLVRNGLGGAEITLQRSRGGFIAEASLESKSYHCSAFASAPSKLMAFPAKEFREVLANDSEFCCKWQSILAREVRKLRAQCERLGLRTAEERIRHYIETEGVHGVAELSMTKKAWATDLSLTHEALYRALKKMSNEGSLRVVGCRMELSK